MITAPHAPPTGFLGAEQGSDRVRSWWVTAVLTLAAAVVRLQDLGSPTDKGTPVFDEKYYAVHAWQMRHNGGFENNAGYEVIVHPPLAKQFLALGEWALGYNGWGWRISSAVAGVLIVLLVVRIARRLTRSTLLGAVAGVLAICDGMLHLQSRMAMLDIFLVLFAVAAFGCLLADRDQVRQRLAEAAGNGWLTGPYGPRLGFRWWRFGAGLMLGLAFGVKWSGLYYVACFGLLCVGFDVAARRAAGVPRPWIGTLRRDVTPALWALLVVPALVYLGTWWAWFAAETATDRHAVETEQLATGGWDWVPAAVRSLAYYTVNVLDFHETLLTPDNDPHPWESKPWTWPMGLRPILYSYNSYASGDCGGEKCVQATMLVGTPALWWLSLPMLAWGLWRWLFVFDWRYAAVLAGYLAGLVFWFPNLDRQMYYFYAAPMAPFLVFGLTLVCGHVLGAADSGFERRGTGLLAVSLYIGLVVANFAWLWPILNGDPITQEHWRAELWLPSWR